MESVLAGIRGLGDFSDVYSNRRLRVDVNSASRQISFRFYIRSVKPHRSIFVRIDGTAII